MIANCYLSLLFADFGQVKYMEGEMDFEMFCSGYLQ